MVRLEPGAELAVRIGAPREDLALIRQRQAVGEPAGDLSKANVYRQTSLFDRVTAPE